MLDCGICKLLTCEEYHRWLSVLCFLKFSVPGLNKFICIKKNKKKKDSLTYNILSSLFV